MTPEEFDHPLLYLAPQLFGHLPHIKVLPIDPPQEGVRHPFPIHPFCEESIRPRSQCPAIYRHVYVTILACPNLSLQYAAGQSGPPGTCPLQSDLVELPEPRRIKGAQEVGLLGRNIYPLPAAGCFPVVMGNHSLHSRFSTAMKVCLGKAYSNRGASRVTTKIHQPTHGDIDDIRSSVLTVGTRLAKGGD